MVPFTIIKSIYNEDTNHYSQKIDASVHVLLLHEICIRFHSNDVFLQSNQLNFIAMNYPIGLKYAITNINFCLPISNIKNRSQERQNYAERRRKIQFIVVVC